MPSIDLIKLLRDRTGAGLLDCKLALIEAEDDIDLAIGILRKKGIAKATDRSARPTRQGLVECYLHRTGDFPAQISAMIELNCESDFVAKSDDFRHLARELALHIVAAKPSWISRADVPEEVLERERLLAKRYAKREKLSEHETIQNHLEVFYRDNCLLVQPWVRDPLLSVEDLIGKAIDSFHENIVVRRFSRYSIREEG